MGTRLHFGGRTKKNRMRGGVGMQGMSGYLPNVQAFKQFASLQSGPEVNGPKGWDSPSKLVAQSSSTLGDFGAGSASTPMSHPNAVAGNGSPSPFALSLGGGRRRKRTKKVVHKKKRNPTAKRNKRGGLSAQLVPWGLTGALLMTPKKRCKGGNPDKRQPSITRPGHLDFITHKGDKYYNRRSHRQTYAQGASKKKRTRPYA